MNENRPLVSVIIPAKDSAPTLERCIKSVRGQTYSNTEIMIVDGQSTDATVSIASALADFVISMSGERSEARNRGARESRGGYLLFLDADMVLSRGVVEECIDAAAEDNSAVIIPEIAVGAGFWSRCRSLEKECYRGDDLIEAARFFPRRFFSELGGYDEGLGPAGEDWDLTLRARKVGFRIVRVQSSIMHDEGELTLAGTMRKKRYYGKYLWRFHKRHGRDARRRLVPWRRAYFSNVKKLCENPLPAAGLAFLKVCESFAAGIGWIEGRAMTRSPQIRDE